MMGFVIGLLIALVVPLLYFAWEHGRWRHGRMRAMRRRHA